VPVIEDVPKESIRILMKEVLDKENGPTWKRKKVRHNPPPTTR
jgi:hypothetical protein